MAQVADSGTCANSENIDSRYPDVEQTANDSTKLIKGEEKQYSRDRAGIKLE